MINKGFEWALRYGEPQNYKPKVRAQEKAMYT